MDETYKKVQSRPQSDLPAEYRNARKVVGKKLDAFASENLTLYEQYRDGKFDKDTFIKEKNQLLRRKEKLQAQLVRLQEQEEEAVRKQKDETMRLKTLETAADLLAKAESEMRRNMYDAIEKVVVYATKEIEIHWKLKNFL